MRNNITLWCTFFLLDESLLSFIWSTCLILSLFQLTFFHCCGFSFFKMQFSWYSLVRAPIKLNLMLKKKDKNQRRKKAAINECEEKEQFRDEIDIIEGKRTILELFVHFFHSIHLPQNSLHSENGAVSNQWLLATIATSRTNSFFCLFKRHRSCWVCVFVCSFSYTKK